MAIHPHDQTHQPDRLPRGCLRGGRAGRGRNRAPRSGAGRKTGGPGILHPCDSGTGQTTRFAENLWGQELVGLR
jgi:hypothetical protein